MTAATLTSKGQITIPIEVRNSMQVKAGDVIEFIEIDEGQFLVLAATQSVTRLKGMFGKSKKKVSIQEMNRVIANQGAAFR